MSDTNTTSAEVIGAIASLVANELNSNPIPMGETGYHRIIHASHKDGSREAHLRTDNGQLWILRAVRLGSRLPHSADEDIAEVKRSFRAYQGLVESKNHALKYAKRLGIEDEDLALQTFYDEVLDDEEREIWNRWSSDGYASNAEWAIVTP